MADEWYYVSGGQQYGPVTSDELRRQAAAGRVTREDLVWSEGMPKWVPITSIHGLLPQAQVSAEPRLPRAAAAEHPRRAYDLDGRDEPVPERRPAPARRNYADDDDFDDAAPRRRRRKKKGMSTGAKVAIGLAAGGGGLLVLALIVVIIVAIANAPKATSYKKSFHIKAGEKIVHTLSYKQGTHIEAIVESKHNTDIDLIVFGPENQVIVADEADLKDARVVFQAPSTGTYRFEVVNINVASKLPVGPNDCTLTVTPPP